jgi:ribosomal protein S6
MSTNLLSLPRKAYIFCLFREYRYINQMVEPRNYEFACHITTKIAEGRAPEIWAEVEALIAKHGGVITFAQQPEPKRLSYPIKHQRQSFFAWVQFQTESDEILDELKEWANLHAEVFRHVILRLEAESDKRAAKQAEHLERKAAKQAKEGSVQKKTTSEKPAADKGKMEKDIEDVIGNL